MENRNKVDFDQKKEKKERKRGFGKIDSSIRITKAKPFEAVVSRSLYTYSTTNEYISF